MHGQDQPLSQAAQRQGDSPAWHPYRSRRKDLSKAIVQARSLIDRGDATSLRQAVAILRRCESKLGLSPDRRGDPEIEGSLAWIAVLVHQPRQALKYAQPFVPNHIDAASYDSHLDAAVLATGRAYLQLVTAGAKRPQGIWSPAKAEPAFAHVQLDPDTHTQRLTAEACEYAQKATTLFDQLAGVSYNGGETQVRAATGCGEALMLLGEYDRGIQSLEFALHFGRKVFRAQNDSSKSGPFLIYIERTLDSAHRLRDISRYSKEYVLYRDAESLRRNQHKYKEAAKKYLACIAAAKETMQRLAAAEPAANHANDVAGPKPNESSPAIQESPFAAASKLYLGQCLIRLGDDGQAIARLEAFIAEDDAQHPKLYRGEALLMLGRVALNHRLDLDQADQYFKQADD